MFHRVELPAYHVGMTGTQSVDRAADLLRLVVQAEAAPSYSDLVSASGLARSTVSRLLGALERGGLVERDGPGYRGGRLFADYAARFDRVEELGEGRLAVTLRVNDPRWLVRLALRLGSAAQVVEPAELRAEVRRTAAAALALYES